MDMSIEHYQQIKDYFKILKMVKLGIDIDINPKFLKTISMIPSYSGSYVEMIEPFDIVLSALESFETYISNSYSEDYAEIRKLNLTTTAFSESGAALMKKFEKDGEFLFYHIDSERLADFPYKLSGDRLNVDGCATIGKTEKGIVFVFVMDFGEPDYPAALEEIVEFLKSTREAERN